MPARIRRTGRTRALVGPAIVCTRFPNHRACPVGASLQETKCTLRRMVSARPAPEATLHELLSWAFPKSHNSCTHYLRARAPPPRPGRPGAPKVPHLRTLGRTVRNRGTLLIRFVRKVPILRTHGHAVRRFGTILARSWRKVPFLRTLHMSRTVSSAKFAQPQARRPGAGLHHRHSAPTGERLR